jgi:hypothetical protein
MLTNLSIQLWEIRTPLLTLHLTVNQSDFTLHTGNYTETVEVMAVPKHKTLAYFEEGAEGASYDSLFRYPVEE